ARGPTELTRPQKAKERLRRRLLGSASPVELQNAEPGAALPVTLSAPELKKGGATTCLFRLNPEVRTPAREPRIACLSVVLGGFFSTLFSARPGLKERAYRAT